MKSLSENMIVLYFRISSEYCKNFVKTFLDNEFTKSIKIDNEIVKEKKFVITDAYHFKTENVVDAYIKGFGILEYENVKWFTIFKISIMNIHRSNNYYKVTKNTKIEITLTTKLIIADIISTLLFESS